MKRIRKVLFVAEAVTLAQVVRLAALARSLPGDSFEVHFASARFDPLVFDGLACTRWPVWSIGARAVERAVAWGTRLYGDAELRRSLADDLRVIDAVRPDVIVGDFRWSLAVAGPVRGVPVLGLANAYWSAPVADFPLPEHPMVRLLGAPMAARHFGKVLPAVFRWFAAPLDRLRGEHGLPPLGSLERVVTWGDVSLFADPGALFPGAIGAVQWAPAVPMPERTSSRPLVYVTLGSSGSVKVVPVVLEALASMDVEVLLATAGRVAPRLPANAQAVEFVPGDLAARAAAVVISNGGSSTGYQALAEGTPVVGLPFNLDQALAMRAVVAAGAGVTVRAGGVTAEQVREAVQRALGLGEGASRLAARMKEDDAAAAFRRAALAVC